MYTVSKDKLQEINKLSAQYDVPVLIHVMSFERREAHQKDETKAASPVEYMSEIGVLDDV